MPDGAGTATILQRSRGRAAVTLDAAPAGGVRIGRLEQSGSAKVFLPRVHSAWPEAVFLNTSGGLTGGDRLAFDITLGAGVRATATTQTAERAYAGGGGTACITVRAAVGAGARLDWLPQETILYEASALDRETRIDLAPDAACLFSEAVILGRQAMGERCRTAALTDRRMVTRAGRPVLAETLRLDADALAAGDDPAILGGARAFAVAALVAPGAEDATAPLRRALDGAEGVRAAVSGWDGRCVLRLLAGDGWPVRKALARALGVLRGGAALPRVWQI